VPVISLRLRLIYHLQGGSHAHSVRVSTVYVFCFSCRDILEISENDFVTERYMCLLYMYFV